MAFPFGAQHIPMGNAGPAPLPSFPLNSGYGRQKMKDKDEERKEERRKAFKGTSANDRDSAVQRHSEQTVSLRKDRRAEEMAKRRAACQPRPPTAVPSTVPDMKSAPEDHLKRYAQMLHSMPTELTASQQSILMDALIQMREWSRVPRFPMAGKIVDARLVSPLMRIYHVQTGGITVPMATEAAWILNNLSAVSVASVKEMVQLGIIDLIYPCMKQPRSPDHFQNSVWLLANICGLHPDFRDMIEPNAVPAILHLTQNETNIKSMSVPALQQLSFLIRNICKVWEQDKDDADLKRNGLPPMSANFRQCRHEFGRRLCPILWLLANHNERQVILNSVEAFRHLLFDVTEGNRQIEDILTQFPQLIKLLVTRITHEEPAVAVEALYCLAHIASGNDNHTQAVVEAGAIIPTLQVLTPPFKKIHKESREVSVRGYFLLSNITGGTTQQCSVFINTSLRDRDGKEWSAVRILLHDLESGVMGVALEACHVLQNLVNHNCVSALPSSSPEYVERMKQYFQVMDTKREPSDSSSWIMTALIARMTNVQTVSVEFLNVGLSVVEHLLHLGQYRSPRPGAVPEYVPVTEKSLQKNRFCVEMESTNGFELLGLLRTEHPNPKIFNRANDILSVFNDSMLDNDFDGPDDLEDGGEEVDSFVRTVLPQTDLKDASNFWSAPTPPSMGGAHPDMKYAGGGFQANASASADPNYRPPPVPSHPMIAPSLHMSGGGSVSLPHPYFQRHPTCGGFSNEMSD